MFSVSSPLCLQRRHLPIEHPQKLQNELRENTAEQTMQAFNQITPKTAMTILGELQDTGILPFFFLAYCSKYQEQLD